MSSNSQSLDDPDHADCEDMKFETGWSFSHDVSRALWRCFTPSGGFLGDDLKDPSSAATGKSAVRLKRSRRLGEISFQERRHAHLMRSFRVRRRAWLLVAIR